MNILHDMLYYAGLFIYTDMVNYWDMCALGLCMLLHRFGFIKMELVRVFFMKTDTEEDVMLFNVYIKAHGEFWQNSMGHGSIQDCAIWAAQAFTEAGIDNQSISKEKWAIEVYRHEDDPYVGM